MSTARKIDPRAFAKQGATHRTENHLPHVLQAQREKEAAKEAKPKEQVPNRGGRPKVFEAPTVRLNLFIPEDTAKRIRHFAVEQGVSPSQLIDEWAKRAELDKAVARGRKAIQEGRVVDQEEAERRLSRWS
jgi:predicted transcriptional regulator